MLRKISLAAAAVALTAAPVAAQAAAPMRAMAPAADESELGGSDAIRALIIIIIGAIGMGILLLTDDNDAPVSP